ncbi:hypothetical protein C8F04DRAFT_1227551 [Mycena alexandri]|uniref:Short-chain dehydrogenase n=1 Tax=Mycena alexandri TaxID=1745969 RepID=A0AAD6TJG0_9AGAR|nr:hypothetical protein C8F04DRAFT_1227551 [Mycena alexandri]
MSLPTFTTTTTAQDVATVFADQIRGKNVLITGTSIGGIGFEAARVLARHANLVIITGYNSERLRLSEEAIKKELPAANIRQLVLDLSSLAAVRKAAAEVNAYPEPLHVLINNAASGDAKYQLTVDGLEKQMATDHIGPFLFTKLLSPKLLAARTETYTPRVVNVSSAAHAFITTLPLTETDVARSSPEQNGFARYGQTKSANILSAIELSKRSGGRINGYSVHPGLILTNINTKEENKPNMISIGILTPEGLPNTEKYEWKTIPQGAATTVAAAFDTRLDACPGAYLVDSTEANDKIGPLASDSNNAATLWTVTEGIIGEAFTF